MTPKQSPIRFGRWLQLTAAWFPIAVLASVTALILLLHYTKAHAQPGLPASVDTFRDGPVRCYVLDGAAISCVVVK